MVACIRRRWKSWATTRWKWTALATLSAGWVTVTRSSPWTHTIDTVGIGNINNWERDPYQGYEDDAVISVAAAPTRRAAWPPPPTAPRS